jgi:hypothetical protein
MRWPLPVLLVLLLAGLVLPVPAAEGNRIGYLSVEKVRIELHDERARVEVDYTLDPGMNLVVLLFGTGDLQRKLERSLNFRSMNAREVGLSRAVFTVDGAAEDYGDRAYWFPAHEFGVTFPRVTIQAPGYSMTFEGARSIPRGFGYFGDMA